MIKIASFLVLLLLVFSAYSNTFQSPPALDDFHSFVEEPKLQIESFSLIKLKDLTQTEFGYSRLLPMATFAWDFYWGKGHISAFHATNLAIHYACLGAVIFFLLTLFRCLRSQFPDEIPGRFPVFWLVFFIAGIWALNPVQTNAVTYLVQRMTSLAAMFYLLSFSFYMNARLRQQHKGKRLMVVFLYFLTGITALGAFLSKQNSATLPLLIILAEILFFTPDLIQRLLRRKLLSAFFAILVIIGGVCFFYSLLPSLLSGYDHRNFTLPQRLLTELRIVSSYILLLILPLPQFMNLEHDPTLSMSLFSPPSTFFALIFLSILVLIAWKTRNRQRLVSFGISWFLINLMIESTIIPLELKFEHRLYLPSIGFYLALGTVFIMLLNTLVQIKKVTISATIVVSCGFIILSVFSSMTYIRNNCWVDNVALYSDCVAKAPMKARNHSNLSRAYAGIGDYDRAIVEAEQAITLGKQHHEEYWVSACNIISAYVAKGNIEQAVSEGERLIQDAPSQAKQNAYPLVLHNLGDAYLKSGDYTAAYNTFLKALDFMCRCDDLPYLPAIENDMLTVLHKVNKSRDKVAKNLGLELGSKASIYAEMALLTYECDRLDRALYYCDLGLREDSASLQCNEIKNKVKVVSAANELQQQKGTLKNKYLYHPVQSRFNLFMVTAYLIERMDISVDMLLDYCLNQAERLNHDSPDVYLLRSWNLYQKKDYEEALKQIDEGIQLDPEYAHLWVNRGIYALAVGKVQVALSSFKKSLSLYPGYPHKDKVMAMITAAEKLSKQKSYSSVNHRQSGDNNG